MRRSHILIGAGCVSVFTIGAGFAIAQQGISLGDDSLAGIEPANVMPASVAPASVRPASSRPTRNRPADGGPVEGGPVLTFGISSTLSATDNYSLRRNNGNSATLFDTGLSFGYLNRRANDVLSFDLDGVLHAIKPPVPGSNTLDDTIARLSYDREGVNSNFSTSAEYSRASVDSIDPFTDDPFFGDDPLDENDLRLDQGDREQISAGLTFETGVTDPIGFIFDGRYREQNYIDTTDPDLYATKIFYLTGTTRFTLSPVSEARVVLRYRDYAADNVPQTDRRTTSYNLGLTQALSEIDTLDVSLGYQTIDTDETILGTRRSDAQNSVIGNLSLTRELTRGTIGTEFNLSDSVDGQIATWLVRRAMPLPRGALEISLGAASDVSSTIRPVGSLVFTHEMLRSTFTATLEQQVAINSESNESLTTRAFIGYNYEINSLSDMEFSANYANVDQADGAANDTTRTNLRATYSRNLTRDWLLSSGYEYRIQDETGMDTATSNRVFLTLQREFTIRP